MEVLTSETIFLQNVFSQAVNLVHVDVRRDLRMNVIAMHLIFKVPIIWMSGYFSLSKAKVFGFIPAGGNGNFNIDLKDVKIGVIATIKSAPQEEQEYIDLESTLPPNTNVENMTNVSMGHFQQGTEEAILELQQNIPKQKQEPAGIDVFEIGIHWANAAFKVDGLWKGFNHLTDFSLNQVSTRSAM